MGAFTRLLHRRTPQQTTSVGCVGVSQDSPMTVRAIVTAAVLLLVASCMVSDALTIAGIPSHSITYLLSVTAVVAAALSLMALAWYLCKHRNDDGLWDRDMHLDIV